MFDGGVYCIPSRVHISILKHLSVWIPDRYSSLHTARQDTCVTVGKGRFVRLNVTGGTVVWHRVGPLRPRYARTLVAVLELPTAPSRTRLKAQPTLATGGWIWNSPTHTYRLTLYALQPHTISIPLTLSHSMLSLKYYLSSLPLYLSRNPYHRIPSLSLGLVLAFSLSLAQSMRHAQCRGELEVLLYSTARPPPVVWSREGEGYMLATLHLQTVSKTSAPLLMQSKSAVSLISKSRTPE
jgi:hypothetical protein